MPPAIRGAVGGTSPPSSAALAASPKSRRPTVRPRAKRWVLRLGVFIVILAHARSSGTRHLARSNAPAEVSNCRPPSPPNPARCLITKVPRNPWLARQIRRRRDTWSVDHSNIRHYAFATSDNDRLWQAGNDRRPPPLATSRSQRKRHHTHVMPL